MQYILTEEEYRNLVPKHRYDDKCFEVKELQKLVMKSTGYICRYDDEEDDWENSYCDRCPLADRFDCGKRKEFSQ